ncbi:MULTISPECIES: TadE/TadG family type IV pilus assembly protein [unclassified Microbacterium]|uniref:TadE/TadG family type IV pilus assembly protein n=1 Tax=Microbacterium sp. zg-B96 TaxID=3049069 RepID=UPI00214CE34B|nr:MULTISPECIES: TadE/TadG family type IV pilus assembly protein [unclassified Microbacterium]MCR2784525.1 pilus assembly protein [Microbacterium sp. zg.B96]WIM17602.1 TadE/TadG family type IV pilus assembly protein [Microbacterium sp. zg-B96]
MGRGRSRACRLVRASHSERLRTLAAQDDQGSSPVEFVLVGALLTVLTLAVLQFGLAVYVRNVVHDAAVEGAFHAALADTTLADGVDRTRTIINRSVGGQFAETVEVVETTHLGHDAVQVTVKATLPLLGLLGAPRALEVSAHAPAESLE